jgi:hypothetical protein
VTIEISIIIAGGMVLAALIITLFIGAPNMALKQAYAESLQRIDTLTAAAEAALVAGRDAQARLAAAVQDDIDTVAAINGRLDVLAQAITPTPPSVLQG